MAQINIAGTLHNTEEIQGDALNSHVVVHTDEILDSNQEKKQSEVNADVDIALADRYTKEETYSKSQVDNLITTPDVQYVTVATYSALPATGEADTIYHVASWDGSAVDAGKYSEYAWNGSAYQLLAVRSSVGEVFDISEYHASGGMLATYADLSAALGTGGENVPVGVRAGGMQVRFINSSTGKYEQCRLMSASWSINVADWQGVDEIPTAGSRNLVESGGVDLKINDCLPYLIFSEAANQTKTYLRVNIKQGHRYRIQKTSNFVWTQQNVTYYFRIDDTSEGQSDVISLKSYESYVDVTADKNYNYLMVYNNPVTSGKEQEVYFFDISEKLNQDISGVMDDSNALTSINSVALGFNGVERFHGSISNGGTWVLSGTDNHRLYEVKNGDNIRITGGANGSEYAFLKLYKAPQDAAAVNFCTGCSLTTVTANASVQVLAPSDSRYLYVTGQKSGSILTPLSLTVNDNDVYAIEPVNTQLNRLKSDVSDVKSILNSLIKNYIYTLTGISTSVLQFKTPVVLSSEGDSLEIIVEPNNPDESLSFSNAGYLDTYYAIQLSASRIGLRAKDKTWLYQSKSITTSGAFKVKIELADGKTYTDIDDVLQSELTYNGQKEIQLSSIGDGGNNGNKGYWKGTIYSVKFNGSEILTPDYVNVGTDVSTQIEYIWDANENVLLPKGVLEYHYDAVSPYFIFYSQKGNSNKYYSFKVGLHTNDNEAVYLKEWRLRGGYYCEYEDGAFSQIASTIYDLENEMAMHFYGVEDYTGGIHGDERIDIDNACFVKFFADGELLTDLSTDFSIECASFCYIQNSGLYQSAVKGDYLTDIPATGSGVVEIDSSTHHYLIDGSDTDIIAYTKNGYASSVALDVSVENSNGYWELKNIILIDHTLIAYHLKSNIFQNCGFRVENTVKMVSQQTVTEYHAGLMCIGKGAAIYALLPSMVLTPELTGSDEHYNADNLKASAVEMWNPNNGIKVSVSGVYLEGFSNENDVQQFQVWDRVSDSKYYRRFVAGSSVAPKVFDQYAIIRNEQIVQYY